MRFLNYRIHYLLTFYGRHLKHPSFPAQKSELQIIGTILLAQKRKRKIPLQNLKVFKKVQKTKCRELQLEGKNKMTCLDERLQTHDQHNSEIRCRKNKEIRPTENTLHELTFNAAQKSERTLSYKKKQNRKEFT